MLVNEIFEHSGTDISGEIKFVHLDKITTNTYDHPGNTSMIQSFKYWDDDPQKHGSIKTKKIFSSLSDYNLNQPILKEDYTYYNCDIVNNADSWLWRLKTKNVWGVKSIDKNDNKIIDIVRATEFIYDTKGNLKDQIEGLERAKTSYTYYEEGFKRNLLKTETDPKGNITTYKYDENISDIFPSEILYPTTASIDHYIKYNQYDHRHGKATEIVDENENKTNNTYDNLGRLVEIRHSYGALTKIEYIDNQSPRYVITSVREEEGQLPVARKHEFFDDMNRLIQVAKPITQTSSSIIQYTYNNMGQLYKTTGPFSHNESISSITDIIETKDDPDIDKGIPVETRNYDYRGRMKSIITYAKVKESETSNEYPPTEISKHYLYSGYETTITDFDEKQRTEIRDCLGRITEIKEHGNESTKYSYSAAGDLLRIEDSENNLTMFNYDTLGRKVDMTDPDMGFWQYIYDANGNLIRQVFPNNKFSITEETIYTYDNADKGRGKLHAISNTDVIKTINAYDAAGREINVTKQIDNISQTTEYKYDVAGRLTEMTYPGDSKYKLNYEYYPGTDLIKKMYNETPSNWIAKFSYNAFDMHNKIDYKNNYSSEYIYEPMSGRLEKINISETTEGNLLSQTYRYYPGGDIESIGDKEKNKYSYDYDDLHRLKKENETPIDYKYTSTGNIESKANDKYHFSFSYTNSLHKHAVDNITIKDKETSHEKTYQYKYDSNGNMIESWDLSDLSLPQIPGRKITYNIFNKPTEIKRFIGHTQQNSVKFLYDGEGVRSQKIKSTGKNVYYFGGHFHLLKPEDTTIKYIFAGNLRIAKIVNNVTFFYHKDHQGSTIYTTSQNNSEEISYYPYGTTRSGQISDKYKFTDQEYDSEIGLYNYNARLYDPVIGRFITPDALVPDMYDPQSLNPYVYCRNNPLKYVDPSGHSSVVLYNNDFETQANAQLNEWSNDQLDELYLKYSVMSMRDFKYAIDEVNNQTEPVNKMVLMMHSHPDFLHLGDQDYPQMLEYLSANNELITPKGSSLNAYPISLLPDINFAKDAVIQLNSCCGGFPLNNRLNIGEAFNQKYNVDTYAFPYWIKYESENSSVVIPTVKSIFLFPRFGPVLFKNKQIELKSTNP